jgi:hypothetical protein
VELERSRSSSKTRSCIPTTSMTIASFLSQQEFLGSFRISRVRSALAYPSPEKDCLSDQRQLDQAAGVHAARPLETYSGAATPFSTSNATRKIPSCEGPQKWPSVLLPARFGRAKLAGGIVPAHRDTVDRDRRIQTQSIPPISGFDRRAQIGRCFRC